MKNPSHKLIHFKNCYILRDHKVIKDDLWIRDGKIINPETIFFDEKRYADEQVDCKGALISSGFIDIQINGGFGVDFSKNLTKADIDKVAKGLLAHGVTSFCPTLVTSPVDVYHKILPLLKKKPGGSHGATILGAHVEGPFINPDKKGAHPPECMKTLEKGTETLLEVYSSLENVAILTLAPEIPGALDTIKVLKEKGITVSVGHSTSNLEIGEAAVRNGVSLITHLFNAMLPFHHRDPGLVGLLASDKIPVDRTVYFGIISDGVHTHPAALRIAHRTHPKGLIIITDAVSPLGLEEGTHTIGQMVVEIKGSKAFVAGTDTLCGSVTTLNECVKFFKKATACSVVEALEAATLHPAEAVNIQHQKGTLSFGSDADFVMLNENLDVWSTWIAGECVYENSSIQERAFK